MYSEINANDSVIKYTRMSSRVSENENKIGKEIF